MPTWLASRPDRRDGPSPFSSEWMRSPAPAAPPSRWVPEPPAWLPGARALSAVLVLLLAATTALAAGGRGAPDNGATSTEPEDSAARLLAATSTVEPAPTTTFEPTPVSDPSAETEPEPHPENDSGLRPGSEPSVGLGAAEAAPTPTYVPMPAFGASEPAAVSNQASAGLLPANRILTYYGHPHSEQMGILGEQSKEELRQTLIEEGANYEAADPSRPVILAFEVIATVAQPVPGDDGTYILDTDIGTLEEYADFTEANDMLLFLDLQIGRGTVADEMEKVRPLLERPHVHLALDPEFAIAEGETPGEYIGELTAESITDAQDTLAALSAELGLPPKVLIVHQFREDMIVGKDRLTPVPGVQLVIDADGYGAPELKSDVYNILVRDEPIEFGGVKLFYQQDKPLMTAAEILALNPSPDLIIYQ